LYYYYDYFLPTSTKPVGRNIAAKQRLKASTSVSLRDYSILERDCIPSLYSHGQAQGQICCLTGVVHDAGDVPANLLCEFNSQVALCVSCLDSEWVEDTGAGYYYFSQGIFLTNGRALL